MRSRIKDTVLEQLCSRSERSIERAIRVGDLHRVVNLCSVWMENAARHLGLPNEELSLPRLFTADAVANEPKRAQLFYRFAGNVIGYPPLTNALGPVLGSLADDPTVAVSVACRAAGFVSMDRYPVVLMDLLQRVASAQSFAEAHITFHRLSFGGHNHYRDNPDLVVRRGQAFDRLVARWFDEAGRSLAGPPPTTSIRRVAVVVKRVSGRRHSPTRLLLAALDALKRAGDVDAAVFETLDLESAQDETPFFPPMSWPPAGDDILDRLTHLGIDRICPSLSANRIDVIRQTVEAVDSYQPDAVLSLDAADSVTKGILRTRYPVVEMMVGGLHSGIYGVDAIVTPMLQNAIREFEALETPSVDRPEFIELPFPMFGSDLTPTPVKRSELGIGEAAFVFATVGNSLHTTVDEPFLRMVEDALLSHPDAVWLVLGPRLPDRLARIKAGGRDDVLAGQVRLIDYREDLSEVLAACDLYLNPFAQLGGGLTAMDALAVGTPVLTLDGGDAAEWVGPNHATPDATAYAERLKALLENPKGLAALGESMLQDVLQRRSFDKAGARLLDVLQEFANQRRLAA